MKASKKSALLYPRIFVIILYKEFTVLFPSAA